MDRFVIRLPKGSDVPKPKISKFRQTRIEDLAGVIKLKEIERCKTLAANPDSDPAQLLRCLHCFLNKRPAAEIIKKTEIGPVIMSLRKHSDERVASVATEVYKSWKKHALRSANRPKLDVEYDEKTCVMREKAITLLKDSLKTEDEVIVSSMEAEIFRSTNSILNKEYKRRVRKLVFALKHDQEFCDSVKSGALSPAVAALMRSSS
ncbi:unnamed protein product [Notodromas monacha]|uniref:Transcription elongation factor A N-terminal and central domain-containing protein 2 n=1 Tax=Notodromas monacha TaxID=399045 RepID=A0A7R9G9Z8_9CRUS|nr:unnamed protein product [Notodromas monacha]CAG0913473.1 unnamed protein product [Notodromas monacha]